ncbi:hypothetical protein ZWY2020_059626 [Hordeum vulgare]|nr:hypothetical protein ZWY2020_059626 [Hordeum vulgare]
MRARRWSISAALSAKEAKLAELHLDLNLLPLLAAVRRSSSISPCRIVVVAFTAARASHSVAVSSSASIHVAPSSSLSPPLFSPYPPPPVFCPSSLHFTEHRHQTVADERGTTREGEFR